MEKVKEIPKFKNEAEEHEFWENHDSTEFLDWNSAEETIFPKLKLSNKNNFNSIPRIYAS